MNIRDFGYADINTDVTDGGIPARITAVHRELSLIHIFWDNRRDEVVGSMIEDYAALIEKLDYDIVTVELVPSKKDVYKRQVYIHRSGRGRRGTEERRN